MGLLLWLRPRHLNPHPPDSVPVRQLYLAFSEPGIFGPDQLIQHPMEIAPGGQSPGVFSIRRLKGFLGGDYLQIRELRDTGTFLWARPPRAGRFCEDATLQL
jgi:hypothetical protein